ncbi:MAG: hypothetical protein Q4D61_04860 [Cardiobacteriaceae bacterium]|nr:hypothetical protein [Cardiobacteriaceae bacterium]
MDKPYPYLKVILGFALLGGLMGGTSAMVCLAPGLRPSLDSWIQTKDFLNLFLQNTLAFAMPPSLLTGLWLAWRRVPRTPQGLMHAAIAGLVFSVLTALVAILFFLHSPPESLVFLLLVMMLAGVVSATFLASWLLPKP